jgi:MerR family transcriptional regulator, light-induced transcriptional regulator
MAIKRSNQPGLESARTLSTRALANAIGVSESSVKRWADNGAIGSARTAGGHRRIPLGDAIRFVRETRVTVVRPEILGLPELSRRRAGTAAAAEDALTDFLTRGAAAEARGLLQALYLDGESLAAIVDGPLRTALAGVGEAWTRDPAGIFVEHRAVDICIQALSQLRLLLPTAVDGLVATGGAVEEDPYLLPSMAAAIVLAGEGFEAVNLGANVPFHSFDEAMERLAPRLVWVSVSGITAPELIAAGLQRLAGRAARRHAHVVAGGRASAALALSETANLHLGGSMRELAAFARGLKAGAPGSPA